MHCLDARHNPLFTFFYSGSGASSSFAADGSSEKVNVYMTILLIAIAALAAVKTIGSTICKMSFRYNVIAAWKADIV